MSYFLIKATSNFGPLNFPIYVLPGQTIQQKVNAEALIRGIIICSDWTAEPITKQVCASLMGH